MFTVKLMMARDSTLLSPPAPMVAGTKITRFSTKIIEATEVDVHILRHGELYELHVTQPGGGDQAFYIANRDKPRPEGFADDISFYYEAYIENSAGKTIEAIRF